MLFVRAPAFELAPECFLVDPDDDFFDFPDDFAEDLLDDLFDAFDAPDLLALREGRDSADVRFEELAIGSGAGKASAEARIESGAA